MGGEISNQGRAPHMFLHRSFVFAFLGFGLGAGAAVADARCGFDAFVRPEVVGAPVVVDAPADGAAHLGAMPMVNDPERGMMGAGVRVTDVKNGFAAVTDVRAWEGEKADLQGWVSARDLAFVVQTGKGFAAPDPASEVVWQGDDWIMPDMIAGIVDCQGEWVALQLADAAVQAPVWVRGVCAGQETTCDGVQGD